MFLSHTWGQRSTYGSHRCICTGYKHSIRVLKSSKNGCPIASTSGTHWLVGQVEIISHHYELLIIIQSSVKAETLLPLHLLWIGPLYVFQIRNVCVNTRHDSLCEWSSARHKATTYTGPEQHRRQRNNIHAMSGIQTQDPSVSKIDVHALDRTATRLS
jgi:hypothetical protein